MVAEDLVAVIVQVPHASREELRRRIDPRIVCIRHPVERQHASLATLCLAYGPQEIIEHEVLTARYSRRYQEWRVSGWIVRQTTQSVIACLGVTCVVLETIGFRRACRQPRHFCPVPRSSKY
jgi:hypothetical protein